MMFNQIFRHSSSFEIDDLVQDFNPSVKFHFGSDGVAF
jgi:hypothetical protein